VRNSLSRPRFKPSRRSQNSDWRFELTFAAPRSQHSLLAHPSRAAMNSDRSAEGFAAASATSRHDSPALITAEPQGCAAKRARGERFSQIPLA
jgi:hypothetical protein